jgi:hypothetical protein
VSFVKVNKYLMSKAEKCSFFFFPPLSFFSFSTSMLPPLLQTLVRDEEDVDSSPETLMRMSVGHNYLEGVEYVLKTHPEINLQNSRMCVKGSPLQHACYCGSSEIVAALLKHPGIDVNYSGNEFSETPFTIACEGGYVDVVDLLLKDDRVVRNTEDKYGCSILIRMAQYNHSLILRKLAGLPEFKNLVDETSEKGSTALFSACVHGNRAAVNVLLNNLGADPTKRQKPEHHLPFLAAVASGDKETVKLWIASGKPIDFEDHKAIGEDLISVAKKLNHEEVLNVLLRYKEDPEKTRIEISKEDV